MVTREATEIPLATARENVERQYITKYRSLSPRGKYLLNYFTSDTYQTKKRVIEFSSDVDYIMKIGNSCLIETPYNPEPKYITKTTTGVISVTEERIPVPGTEASLIIDENDADTLVVKPANTELPDLRLRGLLRGDKLTAADETTRLQLELNGCEIGITKVGVSRE